MDGKSFGFLQSIPQVFIAYEVHFYINEIA